MGENNNELMFYNKISVKNLSQETDIYVGEIAYQMCYTSLIKIVRSFLGNVSKYFSNPNLILKIPYISPLDDSLCHFCIYWSLRRRSTVNFNQFVLKKTCSFQMLECSQISKMFLIQYNQGLL